MARQPRVSICVPVYNGEAHLRQCLDSVASQDYDNLEVVIVDNASTDGTADIARGWCAAQGSSACYYRNNQTLDMVDNFNLTLERAAGEFLLLLPHDDRLAAGAVSLMVEQLSPGDEFLVGLRSFHFEQTGILRRLFYWSQNLLWRADRRFGTTEVTASRYLRIMARNPCHNFLGEPGGVLMSADALSEAGGFETGFHQYCDLRLWHRLGCRHGLKILPRVVVTFRVHGKSQSSQAGETVALRRDRECLDLSEQILREVLRRDDQVAMRPVWLNYLLDLARVGDSAPFDLDFVIHDRAMQLSKAITRIPCKRIYQLLLLRTLSVLLIVPVGTNQG